MTKKIEEAVASSIDEIKKIDKLLIQTAEEVDLALGGFRNALNKLHTSLDERELTEVTKIGNQDVFSNQTILKRALDRLQEAQYKKSKLIYKLNKEHDTHSHEEIEALINRHMESANKKENVTSLKSV